MHRGFPSVVLPLCGGIAVLVGYALFANQRQPGDDTRCPKGYCRRWDVGGAIRQPRVDCQDICFQTGAVGRQGGDGFARVLNKQLETAKKYDGGNMAEPTERLPSEAIYARARAGVVIIGAVPRAETRISPNLFLPVDLWSTRTD